MATGSEILSYKGDPGLAAGTAGTDASLVGTGTSALNPMEPFQDAMQQAWNHQLTWNAMKYAQAVKDRDALYNTFANTNIDFNVDDADRPELDRRITEIKDYMIANPKLWNNKTQWAEMQGKINELNALKSSAKSRYSEAVLQRKAAADELNPITKAEMNKSLQEQLDKGVGHVINPYNKKVGWTPETTFPDVPTQTTYNRYYDKKLGMDMVQEINTTSISDIVNAFTPEGMVAGGKVMRPYEIKDFYDQQLTNPSFQNANVIASFNKRIDEINAETKSKSGDTNFIEHIGEVNPDGSVKLNERATEFGKAYYAVTKYKRTVGEAKPDELWNKAKLQKMQRETGYGNLAVAQGRLALDRQKLPSEIELNKANAARARVAGNKDQLEMLLLRGDALETINNVAGVFQNAEDPKRFKSLASTGNTLYGGLTDLIGQQGVDNTWTALDLGRNSTAMKMLSNGQPTEGGTATVVYPKSVYLLRSPDGDANKSLLVGVMEDGTKKILNANEAGEGFIRFQNGFKPSNEYNKAVGMYNYELSQMMNPGQRGIDQPTLGQTGYGADIGYYGAGPLPTGGGNVPTTGAYVPPAGSQLKQLDPNDPNSTYWQVGSEAYDVNGNKLGDLDENGDPK